MIVGGSLIIPIVSVVTPVIVAQGIWMYKSKMLRVNEKVELYILF